MKPSEKAIEALADVLQHHGVFHGWFPKGLPADWRQLDPIGRREFLDIAGRLADAAYAAQFQSKDYAGLVEELRKVEPDLPGDRTRWYRNPNGPDAADALEALLAERDALKHTADAHVKGWMGQCAIASAAIKERDNLVKERDALLARLAPVEDEALVEIAAHCEAIFDGWTFSSLDRLSQDVYRVRAHQLLVSIRPHIEAAERERCAKIADKQGWCAGSAVVCGPEIAAAIRSGK